MKSRFSSDLLFLIVGPLVASFIAVALGSVIYHATHWDRESVFSGTVGGVVACLVAVRVYFKRRRQQKDVRDGAS